MNIQLYNNLNRRLESFEPANPDNVTVYLCGPTVYNYVHIGNARGPVVFDVLIKLLRRKFPKVTYARNITDVDDKINAAAKALNVPITTITDKYTKIYREDMAALGNQAPDVEPHATDHISHIITMIEQLIASKHAYAAEGHVLFSVPSYADYGKLSRRPVDEMLAGARVEVAPYKKHPGDFVLWKPSTPDLPGWESPWGIGRPGWHIECSAMSAAHLGETIDIHAGGVDLQFPHHENEVAQSTCAHGGKVFARFWLHNGMLNFGGSKMSKSVGNVSVLHELLEKHPAEALRYALLSAQYRQPLDWSDTLIEQSVKTLDRLYGTIRDIETLENLSQQPVETNIEFKIPEDIENALCDDLNTPLALSMLASIASDGRSLRNQLAHGLVSAEKINQLSQIKTQLLSAGAALGLLQQTPEAWFAKGANNDDDARIQALVDERNAAKLAKNFARSDEIRKQLADQGILLEDTAQGVRWKRV
jgi:cysteinyl-tRNA synthetase